MFDGSVSAVIQQLQNIDSIHRLIVLHPSFVERHLLFQHFLDVADVAYVRLSAMVNVAEVSAYIDERLAEQAIRPIDVKWLILDEYDQLADGLLESTLRDMLDKLPNARIVLVGRTNPLASLEDSELKQQLYYVPADEDWLLFDYAQRSAQRPLLEVRAFGSGRVLLDGRVIDNWDGVLPRQLFFYLIDRGMVRRDDIFRAFWPKLNVREATNVFHVTKRKINEILGIDLTIYWSGFYRLSPDIELSYDVIHFTKLVQDSAVADTPQKIHLLNQALKWARRHFLTSVDEDWARNRRQELLQMYQDAAMALADIHFEAERWQQALGLYARAAAYSYQREEIVFKMMRAYQQLGMFQEALQLYAWLEQELRDTLGITPNAELRQLAQQLNNFSV